MPFLACYSYNDYNNKNLLHGKGKRTRKRMVREKHMENCLEIQ